MGIEAKPDSWSPAPIPEWGDAWGDVPVHGPTRHGPDARRLWLTRFRAAIDRFIDRQQGRFTPWLSVALIAGAVLYFTLRAEPPRWAGATGIAIGGILAVLLHNYRVARALAWAGLAGAIGFSAGQFATSRAAPMDPLPRGAVTIAATVRQLDILPQGRRVRLDAVRLDGATPLHRDIRVRLRDTDTQPIESGDTIRLRALLRAPAPPVLPGGWDLQRDAFFTGLSGSGWALGSAEILARPPLHHGWDALRGRIAARFLHGMAVPEGAIAATLFTGTQTAIPPEDRAAFRDSGLAHLLAVAGLHIGIIMGLVFGATRLVLALWEWAALHWPCKQIAGLASLLAGAAYLLLTGGHVPILRSFAMASLVVLALMVGRRAISLRALSLAALVLVIAVPQEVVGVSFQMSFAAVLALIAGYEALRMPLGRLHNLPRHAAQLALTSLLAGAASMPFAAYHFGHVQLYFVLANLIAVPITAMLVMPAGLAALALMPIHLEFLVLPAMGWGIDALLWIGRRVSALPDAVLPVPPMPGWALLLAAFGLCWLCLWRGRVRLGGVPMIALAVVTAITATPPDLLVDAEAKQVAARVGDTLHVARASGASRYTLDRWQEFWGIPRIVPACNDGACQLAPNVLVAADPNAIDPTDCRATSLLIVLGRAPSACPGLARIDRTTANREGATAIWLTPSGVVRITDRTLRGNRPWVLLETSDRRAAPDLPMAPADTMPP